MFRYSSSAANDFERRSPSQLDAQRAPALDCVFWSGSCHISQLELPDEAEVRWAKNGQVGANWSVAKPQGPSELTGW